MKNKVDFQTVVQEAVKEGSILKTIRKLKKTVYLPSRRQRSSASKQLWLCSSLVLKNLAKKVNSMLKKFFL